MLTDRDDGVVKQQRREDGINADLFTVSMQSSVNEGITVIQKTNGSVA